MSSIPPPPPSDPGPPPPNHAGPPQGWQPVPVDAGVTVAATARPNIPLAVGAALAAGVVGGLVWYFIVTLSERQIAYLAIGLGLLVGYATSWGLGRGGPIAAVIAAAVSFVCVVAAYYFISRYFITEALAAEGLPTDLGQYEPFDSATEVLKFGFDQESSQYLYCAICVAAAGFFGYRGLAASKRFGRR